MRVNRIVIYSFIILAVFALNILNAQDKKEKIGPDELIKSGVNYYNYSDKDKVNFEVSVWGYVQNPGKYLIPSGTTFIDLFSLCGGPRPESKLWDIRIIRLKNDSLNIKENKLIVLDYSDYLLEDNIKNINKQNPVLYPGDIILIPGGTKYSFRDNLNLVLAIVTTLISVAVLLVTVFRKN
jgi:hypothetical protein